jgi:hypothetical protein
MMETFAMADERERSVAAERTEGKKGHGHEPGKSRRARRWRHPLEPRIEVSYRVAAAIAVMQMGITEYSVIAEAVGLSIEEVRQIDTAEDCRVRQLAVAGIPCGEYFKLDHRVRCPKCQALVDLAPCVTCLSCQENSTGRTGTLNARTVS